MGGDGSMKTSIQRSRFTTCSAIDNDPLEAGTISYMDCSMGGGEGRIRTSVGFAGRFTVCSLWPLGYLSTVA